MLRISWWFASSPGLTALIDQKVLEEYLEHRLRELSAESIKLSESFWQQAMSGELPVKNLLQLNYCALSPILTDCP